MATLADLLTTPPGDSRGPRCSVCQALARMDDRDANAVRYALADPQWSFAGLSERLAEGGVRISAGSLSRHARGLCGAEKVR